jgi:hypothetical protein
VVAPSIVVARLKPDRRNHWYVSVIVPFPAHTPSLTIISFPIAAVSPLI